MSYYNNEPKTSKDYLNYTVIGIVLFIAVSAIIAFFMWVIPNYNVWAASMAGKAKLTEANQTRQIKITEAKAHKESAIYEAQAEVERAKGMAQANHIVGNSLKGHEDYLMYLYIQNMHQTKNQIIYIPTEGGMPILEASRLTKNAGK